MKTKHTIRLILLFVLFSLRIYAQDTLIVFNKYKYKFGTKFIVDRSNDYNLTPTSLTVMSGGIQIIRKFDNSKSSIETGFYKITKAVGLDESNGIIYNNISIPINYRLDTKVIYIAGGFYVDYLIYKYFTYEIRYNTTKHDRKLNLGFNLCLGIEKQINKELSLIVEARTFNNLTSSRTDRGNLFEPSYSNNGFGIGINYKLLP